MVGASGGDAAAAPAGRTPSAREAAIARDMPLIDRLVYRFLRRLIVIVGRVYFRLEVHGAENVPARGAFIVSPVHRSNLDTPLMAFVTTRRMRYMGKDTLWHQKYLGRFLTALGGFPVVRGTADREALRACETVVARGEPLVMFPEGTRRSGAEVVDLFDGPAFVAARQGVPILPIGLGGTEGVMPKGSKMIRPKKVTMVIGRPIHPPVTDTGRVPRRVVRELTEELRKELQVLFDDARRRAGD